MKKIITVDGPAGSGKEKISRYIARKYKLHHLDSGTLYRRLAYELSKKNIKSFEIDKIRKFIKMPRIRNRIWSVAWTLWEIEREI